MHFAFVSTAFLIACATALPQAPTIPDEEIKVENLTIRRDGDVLNVVDFSISNALSEGGDTFQCTQQNPVIPTGLVKCVGKNGADDTTGTLAKWSFELLEGQNEPYRLSIYHALSAASGRRGASDVFVYCHKGPSGPNDYVCTQTGTIVIGLNASP